MILALHIGHVVCEKKILTYPSQINKEPIWLRQSSKFGSAPNTNQKEDKL